MFDPPQSILAAKSQFFLIQLCAWSELSVSVGMSKEKLAASRFHWDVREETEEMAWAEAGEESRPGRDRARAR